MAVELEELKQRQDALEEVVRHLEHRLTMDEFQLNSIGYMGPPVSQPVPKALATNTRPSGTRCLRAWTACSDPSGSTRAFTRTPSKT